MTTTISACFIVLAIQTDGSVYFAQTPMIMRRVLPIALLVLISATTVTAKEWRGILPLHSTRAHVEALLGPPPENRAYTLHKGRSIYHLDEGEVYIVFADEDFLTRFDCPSVAAGTVVMIQVTPRDELLVNAVNLDDKSFTKFDPSDPPDLGYEAFLDEKEGFIIRAYRGKVEQLTYVASAADRARCPGYYADLKDFVQIRAIGCSMPFDHYGDIRFGDEKARLDNFAIQLLNEENSQGHIVVYAGRKATVAEAQLRANRARDYMITVRKIDPRRVKAVDGGYREELSVVLHLVPSGAEPPALMPTLDPSQVEIIYEQKRRSQKKRR